MTTTYSGSTRPAVPRPRIPAVLVVAKAQAFSNALARRRTVREFSNRPVPPGVVEAAARAAATAAEAPAQLPCVFVATADQQTRRRLRAAAEADREAGGEFRLIESAPLVIAVFERGEGKGRSVHESVGIAIGFLLTTIAHSGLSAVSHPVGASAQLNEILGRPAEESAFMLISVGYPTEAAAGGNKTAKGSLEEVLHWR